MANSTRFLIELPDVGLDTDTWGTILNNAFSSLEQKITDKTSGDSITGGLSVSGNLSTGGTFAYGAEGTTTAVSAFQVPVGSTAQRPAGVNGKIRYNTTISQYEGFTGSVWASIGGGATGGGPDRVFQQNERIVTTPHTIPAGIGASTVGPITFNAAVTVSSGSRLVIL